MTMYRREVLALPIVELHPSAWQSRESPDVVALGELAVSMERMGLLQPILVRRVAPLGQEPYWEIVAGHRRVEAARALGWDTIEAQEMETDDRGAAEILLEENLRRKDLNPLEKARFLRRYMEIFGVTQEEAGTRFNMAQETVSHYLSLLDTPPEIARMVQEGRLTLSHVKALNPLREDPKKMARVAEAVAGKVDPDLGVQQAPLTVALTQERVADELRQKRGQVERAADRRQAKEKVTPALAQRLTEGMEPTGDKQHPWRDPAYPDLPLYFARVRHKGVVLRVEPALLVKSPPMTFWGELRPRLEAEGLKAPDYGYRFNLLSAVPQEQVQAAVGKKCCGGPHIAVRGWGHEKGDPVEVDYSGDTDTKGNPKTVIYCSDPAAVYLALARVTTQKEQSREEALAQARGMLETFLKDVAPVAPGAVLALWAASEGVKVERLRAIVHNPKEVLVSLAKRAGERILDNQRWDRGPSLQQVIEAIAPALQPKKE